MDKKILFADLDGTLIDTISGATFPKGIWDMKLKFDVIDKIKELGFECLIIITNQGGIEKGFVNERDFTKGKMNFICMGLSEYLGIPVDYNYCPSNDKENHFRKPNIGMLNAACKNIIEGRFHMASDKQNMLMIGDASGKEGQFSDSDKKTAENFGIDYMDIYDFVNYREEEL